MNNNSNYWDEIERNQTIQKNLEPSKNQLSSSKQIPSETGNQQSSYWDERDNEVEDANETWGGWLVRNMASNTLRGIEGFSSAIPSMERAIDPETLESLNLSLGKSPKLAEAIEKRKEFEQKTPQQRMRESMAQLSNKYTEPKNAMESWINNFSEIGGALAGGRALMGQFAAPAQRDFVQRFYQDFAVPFLGASVKTATDSDKAAWASMMAASMLNPRGTVGATLNQSMLNTMTQLEAQIPPTRVIPIQNTIHDFLRTPTWNKLYNSLPSTPSLQPLRNILNEFAQTIRDTKGLVSTQRAIQISKNINEIRNNLGAFKFDSSDTKKAARGALKDFYDSLRNNVYDDMNHLQQGLGDAYRMNAQGQAVLSKSDLIKTFINRITGKQFESDLAKNLFGGGKAVIQGALGGIAATGGKGLPSASTALLGAGAGTAALGAYQASKFIYRISNSARLRQLYTNILRNASEQNVGQTVKLLNQFDTEAKNEESKSKRQLPR